jgi:DNA uptake protein ComE-like DNA-binding protein
VNRAGVDEIDALPGLSRRTAEALVSQRRRRGSPFRRPADLLEVPGIKEKRLSKILPFLAPFADNK